MELLMTPVCHCIYIPLETHSHISDAINHAISDGGRCGANCGSSTIYPAVVYFPPGNYLVSSSIIQYYNTQLIGDVRLSFLSVHALVCSRYVDLTLTYLIAPRTSHDPRCSQLCWPGCHYFRRLRRRPRRMVYQHEQFPPQCSQLQN